jgi:hypothetical protein
MTNASKIRAMSDKELARLLDDAEGAGYNDSSITPRMPDGWHMDMLDWLQQEAEEGK